MYYLAYRIYRFHIYSFYSFSGGWNVIRLKVVCNSKAGRNAAFSFMCMVLNKKGKRQRNFCLCECIFTVAVAHGMAYWPCTLNLTNCLLTLVSKMNCSPFFRIYGKTKSRIIFDKNLPMIELGLTKKFIHIGPTVTEEITNIQTSCCFSI